MGGLLTWGLVFHRDVVTIYNFVFVMHCGSGCRCGGADRGNAGLAPVKLSDYYLRLGYLCVGGGRFTVTFGSLMRLIYGILLC